MSASVALKAKNTPSPGTVGRGNGLERFMPRQSEKTAARKREKHSWTDTPGFGMWADREEMTDPAAYVRNIRKPRYTL
ncbi:hypothetical protein [Thiothrix unzii]|uniref:hypothetical protein n=1 Tax=Thiothrix unzii TaxID=111769 RepID=UPI002A35F601|nr:hypothetical protein [Thiothrix unzii]MDX9989397.1 hypothetical protein [Thiothrix unzii]